MTEMYTQKTRAKTDLLKQKHINTTRLWKQFSELYFTAEQIILQEYLCKKIKN